MRCFIRGLVLLIIICHALCFAQTRLISVTFDKASLQEVIQILENKTSIRFVIDYSVVSSKQHNISFTAKNVAVWEILDKILAKHDLRYQATDKKTAKAIACFTRKLSRAFYQDSEISLQQLAAAIRSQTGFNVVIQPYLYSDSSKKLNIDLCNRISLKTALAIFVANTDVSIELKGNIIFIY